MIPQNAVNATSILLFFSALSSALEPNGYTARISEMNQKDPRIASWTFSVRVLPEHRRVDAYGVFTLELDSLSFYGSDTLIADSKVEFFAQDDTPIELGDGRADAALTALHEGMVAAAGGDPAENRVAVSDIARVLDEALVASGIPEK